jgi:hypothetical protein
MRDTKFQNNSFVLNCSTHFHFSYLYVSLHLVTSLPADTEQVYVQCMFSVRLCLIYFFQQTNQVEKRE